MYKAIIYDIDNTLLDTLEMNMIPLQQIIKEELGQEWSYEEVLKFSAYPGMKVMEELGIQNKEEVYQRWVDYVNNYQDKAKPYPHIIETIKHLHNLGIRQAIMSSKTHKQYDLDMPTDLIPCIETKVLFEDTTKHKPDEEPLLLCLEKLHLNKDEVIYIGDAYSDYQACLNAGIDFGYALWGSASIFDVDSNVTILKKPKDLLKLGE